MFTGLIRGLGQIVSKKLLAKAAVLRIKTVLAPDLQLGDSVAVNGVCLTVARLGETEFQADVMPETFRGTNLASLQIGERVNLEPALAMHERLGGHLVSGHVDGVGRLVELKKESNALLVTVEIPTTLLKLAVVKGSIALNGVSLTIQKIEKNLVTVSLIPHTVGETTFALARCQDPINLEMDQLARYLFQEEEKPANRITKAFLAENGYL